MENPSVKTHLRRSGLRSIAPKANPAAITPTHGISTYRTTKVKCGVIWMEPGWCSNVQSHASFPNDARFTRSSKLWDAIMPTPNTAIQRTGSRTMSAMHTILQPKIQMTAPAAQGVNVHEKSIIVSSKKMSHNPRVKKNRETWCTDFPRDVARNAPVPAKNANTGAQK